MVRTRRHRYSLRKPEEPRNSEDDHGLRNSDDDSYDDGLEGEDDFSHNDQPIDEPINRVMASFKSAASDDSVRDTGFTHSTVNANSQDWAITKVASPQDNNVAEVMQSLAAEADAPSVDESISFSHPSPQLTSP